MAESIGGHDSSSYSWGTGETWCIVRGTTSNNSNGTQTVLTLYGATTSGNSYSGATSHRMSGYGVRVRCGHNGGGGTGGNYWENTGNYDYNADVAKVNASQTFTRGHSSYNVTIYTSYWGESVSGHSASSNSGSTSTTVTIPARSSYAIKYDANGGSGAPSNQTKWHAETLTLSTTVPTRDGYTFAGWNTVAAGTGTTYVAGGSYTANSGAMLYAQWVPLAPLAPLNFKAERVSDTKMSLSWETNAEVIPWDGVYIDRITDTGEWTTVATLSATTTSYVDIATSANHRYQYRARSYNVTDSAASDASSYLFTTPAAFTSIAASKPTTSTVALEVSGLPTWYDSTEFQASTDSGATWKSVTTLKSAESTWTDSKPLAGTVYYRGRAIKNDLVGEWVVSNSVITIQAPNAPTIMALESVYATGTELALMWTKNHPDGTAQTKAQVEIVAPAAKTTTVDIVGATSSYTISLTETGNYKVRVRTYGLATSWGAWSSYSVVYVADAPVPVILTPETDSSVLSELPYAATWSIADSTGVSYQQVILTDANGNTIINSQIGTDVRSYELTGAHGLENNSNFTLTLFVRGGSGLTATVVRKFTTGWEAPEQPPVTITVDDTYSVHILFGVPQDTGPDGVPDTIAYSLTRIMPDGKRTVLITGAKYGQEFVDYIAPLNTPYEYLVVSYAESGATNHKTYITTVNSEGNELYNFGTDASTVLALAYDATGQETISRSGESFHFALGDETENLPTIYPDGDIDVSIPHTYTLNSKGDYARVRKLARVQEYALCWFRNYWGDVYRVFATFSLSYDAQSYNLWQVSVDMTENTWEDLTYAND